MEPSSPRSSHDRRDLLQATVTQLLQAVDAGDSSAVDELFRLVYEELQARARQQRRRWHGPHSMNTTALVHEAYLKLVDRSNLHWESRAHFLSVASKAMRHILIDYARARQRKKRGGDVDKLPFDEVKDYVERPPPQEDEVTELLALDAALQKLGKVHRRPCEVVVCRFFGGMTIPDTARALDISASTVKRDWQLAQAWLYHELKQAEAG